MTQIGAVGGEFWRIGSEMLGSHHGTLDMCPLAGNTQWLQWLQWGVTFSQVVWLIGC